MSTQKSKAADDESNLKLLRELLGVGGNRTCFDCGQRGPTYVNTTIGSFVCTACSGRLRGLTPPHRIKSITMATFTSDEMNFIRSRGNNFCRKVWLGRHESPVHNQSDGAEEGQVADDLTQKYERKQWYVEPTEGMFEEARRANASVPVKKVKATLISQAHQVASSRGIPSIGTQSVQRPMPGNVRSLPGAANPHPNPTVSSLPQSPNKYSPQTPKSTIAPPVWGIQESPSTGTFQTGTSANFADFSSVDFASPPQRNIFSTGLPFGCQPFSPPPSSAKEPFISTGESYKPAVPLDRYAALAELDSTCGSDASDFSTCGTNTSDKVPVSADAEGTSLTGDQYLSIILQQYVPPGEQLGSQSQHLPPSGATNPFGSAAVAVSSATFLPFLPSSTVLSSPFAPMAASHATTVQAPSYFGANPQSGVSWNGNSYHISQQFTAASSSNPFIVKYGFSMAHFCQWLSGFFACVVPFKFEVNFQNVS